MSEIEIIGERWQPPARIVFLDMDGVLADFVGATCDKFGVDKRHIENLTPDVDLHDFLGVDEDEFQNAIADAGFWASLSPLPYARQLVEACQGAAMILTAPAHGECAHGKMEWVRWHFPHLADRMIITRHKGLLANDMRMMVDDKVENVWDYTHRFFMPQPWNEHARLPTPEDIDRCIDQIRVFRGVS